MNAIDSTILEFIAELALPPRNKPSEVREESSIQPLEGSDAKEG